jgi:hypothetical protein
MPLRSTLSTLLLLVALLPVTQAANHVLEIKSAADYVTIPDSDSLDLASTFTLEAWINPSRIAAQDQGVVAQNRSPNGTGFSLRVRAQGASLALNDGKTINIVGGGGTELSVGNWSHIATTYDGTTARTYINGELKNSYLITLRLAPTREPLIIGQEDLGGNHSAFLGLIDEVRVWNRALSAEEIQSRMSIQLTGEEPGLVGYWNFDDQTAKDRSVYHNDGELIGGAQLVEDPLIFLQIHRAVEIISVSGSSTSTYQLQFKPDATADEWTNLGEPFTGGEPIQFFDSTTSGQKLYRAIRIQ